MTETTTEPTYAELVASERMTCESFPHQVEGTLRDGRRFYFRYRSDRASLGVGATDDAAVHDGLSRPPLHVCQAGIEGFWCNKCGWINERDEYERIFLELWKGLTP